MSKRVTKNEYIKKIKALVGNDYSLIGEFNGLSTKAKFKCNKCGNIFYSTPNNFVYKHCRCPICKENNHAKSPEKFSSEFKIASKGEYTQISKYVRSHTKIMVRHNVCGHKYEVTPHEFLSGRRCPYCFGNKRKTTKEFSDEVYRDTNGEYKVCSEYINNKEKVKMKHTLCNSIYEVTPHDFISGNRCPKCRASKGEKLIESILKELNVNYECQKIFKGCTTGIKNSYLKFDFYIQDFNLIIEYDGIQHFKPIDWFGGKSSFDAQKQRDDIKNRFAHDNNILIIRIPYTCPDNEVRILLKKYICSRKAGKPTPKCRFMI